MDKLILWLTCLLPVFLMAGAILYPRWRALSSDQFRREAFWAAAATLLLGSYVAYDCLHADPLLKHRLYLQRPWALAALVPVLLLVLFIQSRTLSGIARGRMWTAFLLRSAIMILLVLAIAGLQVVVEKDTLSVLFALDGSKSVPESERQRAIEFMRKSVPNKKANDEAGLLVFGGKAVQERSLSNIFQPPDAKNIKSVVQSDATDISLALRRSLAAFGDESSRRRLILFTDGRETTGDAAEELKRIVAMGVDTWIVPLRRDNAAEMLIEKLVVPNTLLWEQPFDAHVFVYSNVRTQARVRIYPGDRLGQSSYEQTVDLEVGKNRVTFPGLRMHTGGAKELRAVLEPLAREDDTLTENNERYAFTDVQTENRVLVLTSDLTEVKNLLGALEGERMTLDVRTANSIPENPEAFRAYDCIIMANLARGFLSDQQMKVIETCVKDQGAGLIMIGGDQSFGAGGYLNTPIEEALPVRMDLQNQKVQPSGALCLVLHTCEFPEGNSWGKKIAKAAIKTLSPQDYAGLILYSWQGGEQWVFKPALVRDHMFKLIDKCEPGDMPSLDTITSMAVTSLTNLNNVSLKHCIVITDGDPSPPTASTIAAAKAGKITITTISIYPHGGVDLPVLKDIASQTGGRYYSADDPKKLPQIFIKEAAVVRKSLIRSDEKGIPVGLGMPGPTLKEFGKDFPSIQAFVVTTPKERAEMQLYTVTEGEKVPILMSWHYGLGKAAAFTSDATTRWAPEWVKWPSYKKFWVNLITWAGRQRMPSNHTVTTRLEGDQARVIVEGLDSKGEYINFAKLSGTAIDPDVSRNGLDGQTYDLSFTMTAPGRYEATFPVKKAGAYAIAVVDNSDPKKPSAMITGLANSYSAEFLHLEGNDLLLAKLGEVATGKSDVNRLKDLSKQDALLAGVFAHDLPPARQPTDLFWLLLLLALCLFPFDVAVRRLALDPEKGFIWAYGLLTPVLARLKIKQRQFAEAAVDAIAPKQAPPPPEIVPSGERSREAQSRYEQAGGTAEAQNVNLDPKAQPTKPVVGGTKLSPVDAAASDYTKQLLKAKKRAKKDE